MVAQPESRRQRRVKEYVVNIFFQFPRDTARLESILAMIDTWSIAYTTLSVIVAIAQVTLLKRFFNVTPTSSNLKMRT